MSIKMLTTKLKELYPSCIFSCDMILVKILDFFFSSRNIQEEVRGVLKIFKSSDQLTFNFENEKYKVETNLQRIVWLLNILFNSNPSFIIEKFNEFCEFYKSILLSERHLEGNPYSLEAAKKSHEFFIQNQKLFNSVTLYPTSLTSKYKLKESPSSHLSFFEMSTRYLLDQSISNTSAVGYQDKIFRPEHSSRIILYCIEDLEKNFVWYGDHELIPSNLKKYYIHPEAVSIHLRNGINLKHFKKVIFHKTSSPRSFLEDSHGNQLESIKLSLPRWFGGGFRLFTSYHIQKDIFVGKILNDINEAVPLRYKIVFWNEYAGCCPTPQASFGMTFRKVLLDNQNKTFPFFCIGQLNLSLEKKVDILLSAFEKILYYAFNYGIILECHSQNLLFTTDNKIIYRDNGGIFLEQDLITNGYKKHEEKQSFQQPFKGFQNILHDRLWRLFCGSILYSCTAPPSTFESNIKLYNSFFQRAKPIISQFSKKASLCSGMQSACLVLDKEFNKKYLKA